ncbi:hypothetical protein F441_22519 [Phytophthora nicotianae CJ01A1]|uniref:Uncharacterized protein n=1 Tax=Phytophthora nicotianae CJ01A1 TaxID=1317063 RepID=W2VRP8_PHYNI|nr:hypothetical protein F441_22519 [Phytophthora nicotianae CJ01A1]
MSEGVPIVEPTGPMVDHPQYDPPKSILRRPAAVSNHVAMVSDGKKMGMQSRRCLKATRPTAR